MGQFESGDRAWKVHGEGWDAGLSAARPPTSPAGGSQPLVLVVDDEPRILDFLVENLRADDFSVLTAEEQRMALRDNLKALSGR